MRAAFYITVDDRYAGIGLAQAKRLQKLWGLDVHVFIEGAGNVERDSAGSHGVFVHRNLMRDLIPDNLPTTAAWPRIIYGRIYAPFVMPEYDRLIYLDADVYPMRAAHELLNINPIGGIAAVQDSFTISDAPHVKGLSREEWRESIGLKTGRYFNSGFLMIDRGAWVKTDFTAALQVFVQQYGAAARMSDQDFLNHHFQGRWVELSPRFNFQMSLVNYGYEGLFPPVFLHFSSFLKPWLKDDIPESVQGQFFPLYNEMFLKAGVDPSDYHTTKREKFDRKVRRKIRYALSQLNIVTKKEQRLRSEWERHAAGMFDCFCKDGLSGRYADMVYTLNKMPQPDLVFDGQYLRRALDLNLDID